MHRKVGNFSRIHKDADFAACLYGIYLLNPFKTLCNALKVAEAF
jgi:hypothetical protein